MKRTIESLTPPENKQVMWLDVSGKVKQLKVYINGEWVVVNDDTENNEEIVKKVLEIQTALLISISEKMLTIQKNLLARLVVLN